MPRLLVSEMGQPDGSDDGISLTESSRAQDERRYDFSLKLGRKELSGIMVARTVSPGTVRVVGATYFGMTLFDMTLKKDSYTMNSVAEPLSGKAFASFIDISPATLSSIFNGRTKPTISIIEAIKKKIPNINTDWLMFGSGSMFSDAKDQQSDGASPTPGVEEGMLDFGYDDNVVVTDESKNEPARVHETNSVRNTPRENPKTEIKFVDKPQRHVVEIKVYYDDFTYESFYPAPKK